MFKKVPDDDEWMLSLPKMSDEEWERRQKNLLSWIRHPSGEISDIKFASDSNFGFKRANRKNTLRLIKIN
jgi:hypothetical protein